MRRIQWLMALSASALISGAAMAQPGNIAAAIADPGRPATDAAQDAERHVAEVAAFAEVKAGTKIVDLMPGGGYYTRIWSKLVGPTGHVYATSVFGNAAALASITGDAAYSGNTSLLTMPLAELKTPEPVDVVFTSRNYHDLHNRGGNPAPVNAAVFGALKKGGLFVVLDHRALPGVVSEPMHRMDPELVKKEVQAAGFQFVRESQVLARADDPKNVPVFDPSVRGKTDNFLLLFRKP